jgi:hypothetical protein
MNSYDRAAEAVADANAVEAANTDPDAMTGEEIVNLALGRPPGRKVRTGDHTYIIEEN